MFLIQDLVVPHHVPVLVLVLEVSARERGSHSRRSRGSTPVDPRMSGDLGQDVAGTHARARASLTLFFVYLLETVRCWFPKVQHPALAAPAVASQVRIA